MLLLAKMKECFRKYILDTVEHPREEEVEEILSIFSEKKFKKGDLFKKRDHRMNELGFLINGSSRSLMINNKGEEITGQICQSNDFLSEIISVRTKDKSPIIIEFLEQSEVVTAVMKDVKRLLQHNLTFNIVIREHMADRIHQVAIRQTMFLTGTAKERYIHILQNNPYLLKKFPLRFIATMIGITPTQLSRIRNEKI